MGRHANAGFSTADPARLYLPIDPDPGRPTVAAQEPTPAPPSTWSGGSSPCEATPALGARATTRVLHEGYPLAYLRGETHLVVVNPRADPAVITSSNVLGAEPVLVSGATIDEHADIAAFGYGIFVQPHAT